MRARALEELYEKADHIIANDEANIIILSDRGIDREHAPIPVLLAVSGLHHHLIRKGTRTHIGLIVESGEPREVHHFAMLIGYGAVAINPYLAYATIEEMIKQGLLTGIEYHEAAQQYTKAVVKGVVKVLSKMGISTIQSYCGSQIFEAVGLNQAFIDRYFTGTPSRIGGVGIEVVSREAAMRHAHAFPARPLNGRTLDAGGQYQWREDGEHHLFNPETVYKLQQACRTNNYPVFQQYAELINNQSRRLGTLRGLLELKLARKPLPIEKIEPVESIVRRFKTGAMSYGSISKEAHETLAIAMNRIGGKSNTGEGGEDPARYTPTRTAIRATAPSSRWLRRALGSPATTWSTRRSCKSRWRRAPNPAKAGSCRAGKYIPGLPKSAIPPLAWVSSRPRRTTTFTRLRTWPS